MTKRKERGILDMLTAEQAAVIDSHGYAFLAEQGYLLKVVFQIFVVKMVCTIHLM